MRTIIHDLKDISHLKLNSDDILVGEVKNNCIGCFSCWVKHPLNCIFNDKIKNNSKNVLDSDELIIISKCVNGSYSSKVKRILERSISYVLPFFTVRNNSIHHSVRTDKKLKFKVYYYGDDITEFDRYVADKFVNANANNLNTEKPKIYFYKDYGDINI